MGLDRSIMLSKLEALAARYDELLHAMADPRVLADQERFQQAAREQASLEETVSAFREYQRVSREADEAAGMARDEPDPELREFARAEEARLRVRQRALDAKLRDLLTPKDPLADRNIIMEIRAGTGGDEASLFAGDLFRMYERYAAKQGWKTELISASSGTMGGYKEVIAEIHGRGAFSRLKFESGVHRVQRVPATETSERIRTYNFPQARVTDHRINLTLYKLPQVIEGEALGEIIDALVTEHQAALLADDATRT